MTGFDYSHYLRSAKWRHKRVAALQRAGYRCEWCEADRFLQVHHLTYRRLGNEAPGDLRVLCWACHKRVHRIRPLERPIRAHAPVRPPLDHGITVTPDAAKAMLGPELRSYAVLVRSELPGQGRKRAQLRRLGDLAGRLVEVDAAIAALAGQPQSP